MTLANGSRVRINLLNDRVLLRREAPGEQTRSGLVIVYAPTRRTNFAEVVAVGPGRPLASGVREKPCFKVGDRVVIEKYGGSGSEEVDVEGEKLWGCRVEDVLGVCE